MEGEKGSGRHAILIYLSFLSGRGFFKAVPTPTKKGDLSVSFVSQQMSAEQWLRKSLSPATRPLRALLCSASAVAVAPCLTTAAQAI